MSLSINAASARDKLQNIAAIISKHECTVIAIMKSLIRELTIVVNGLSNSEKIQFIEEFSKIFKLNHHTYPEAMELYFTQIITIIDANLSLIIDFTDIEFMQLAKLSNDTMRMIVTEFEEEPCSKRSRKE
jgi:hypothetical protein